MEEISKIISTAGMEIIMLFFEPKCNDAITIPNIEIHPKNGKAPNAKGANIKTSNAEIIAHVSNISNKVIAIISRKSHPSKGAWYATAGKTSNTEANVPPGGYLYAMPAQINARNGISRIG